MKNYTELKEKYLEEFRKLRKNYNIISFLRLIVVIAFLFSLYYYIKNNNSILILCLLLELITFIFLMRIHERISWRLKIRKTLMRINEDELNYLKRKNIPFEDGTEYNDHSHYYSYDLDIFGKNSLFGQRLKQMFCSQYRMSFQHSRPGIAHHLFYLFLH